MPKVTFGRVLNLLIAGVVVLIIGRYFYMKPRFVNGEAVPTLSATLRNGEAFELSDLRGHYVLLDFWGSWCGPCRAENPGLVALHRAFENAEFDEAKGLAIVSIGIEEDRGRWERAIKRDSLYWPYHIFDQATSLRFFDSPIANDFGVKQLPTKYLLNPSGHIIAVNPSIDELRARLNSHLPN